MASAQTLFPELKHI